MAWTATPASRNYFAALTLLLGLLLAPVASVRAQAVPAGQGLVADETELQVLREFYAATNGASWGTRTNWLSGTTLASAATWVGVGVSNGDVVSLNLGYNQLSGQLPPRLGELRALQLLDLRNNQLTGPIPASLGQCTRLQWLILEYNQLTGSVPAELGTATDLQNIFLSGNALTGELRLALSNLHLRQLWLYDNQLTGVFPAWLLQQPQLEGLGLGLNHFSGPLPAGLGQLGNLTQLYLNDNEFTEEVPAELGQLVRLTDLALSGNRLTGSVPPSLGQLSQLQWLYLSENEFTDIPSWVGMAPNLHEFYVANNRLGFDRLERNFTTTGAPAATDYNYAPQHPDPGPAAAVRQAAGTAAALDGTLAGAHNRYQWQRWQAAAGQWADLPGQTQPALRWAALARADAGRYRAAVTNTWAVNLTLYSRTYALEVDPAPLVCPTPPALTLTPAQATLAAGDAVTLQVSGGPAGSALTFDGVDDQVLLPSPAESAASLSATLTNTFTVEAWVNPAADHEIDPQDNTGTGGTHNQRYVLFPAHSAGGFDRSLDHAGMGLSVGRNGVSVYEHTGNYMPAVLVWAGSLTGWNHIAVVYKDRLPRLYVNGVLKQTGVVSAKPYVHPSYEIGGGVYGFYPGGIDEFRIWRTAREAGQVAADYHSTLLGDEVGLAGCWHFDEGRGADAFDATAARRGGLLTRGAHWNGSWNNYAELPPPTAESAQWQVPSTAPALMPVFRWSPAAGLDRTDGPAVSASPAATTTYTVTAPTTAGCPPSQATVTVTVGPPPPLLNPPVDGCAPALVNAPPAEHRAADPVNFVRTYTPRVALTEPAQVEAGDKQQVQVRTEYLDGLGRPVQTVLRQESPLSHDIVQPVAYDALGRQTRQYLPYVTPNTTGAAGDYHPNALLEQYDFYRATPTGPGFATDNVARSGVAYSETAFEASPLNRVRAQAAPGEAWRLTPTGGHAVRRQERPNTAADAIPRLVPGYGADARTLTYAGDYAAGELWVVESRDEQGSGSQEFKDKQGQVVAKATEAAAGTWLRTCYAFDDFGRLRAVVPPKAVVALAATGWQVTPAVDALLFRYRCDGRGRVIAKQVPGTRSETMLVYDQLDRPVLSQDAQQRQRQEWAWTKYDALGRPVLTGLLTREAAAETLQGEADASAGQAEARTSAAPYYYSTTQAYPRLGQGGFSGGQVLTVTYYDDYDFTNDGAADAQYDPRSDGQFTSGPAPVADGRVTGQVTRTRVRVLGVAEGQPGAWLTSTSFYDERARPIQVQGTNARGFAELVTSQLDFAGRVQQSVTVHHGPNLPAVGVQVAEFFTYDHAGRLLTTTQQVMGADAAPVPVATNRYNEVGQLARKTLAPGQVGGLEQPVDYRYNIRGWLTHLNDADNPVPGALFNLTLSYDCGFAVPQYNGNIAGQKWRGRDGVERAYGYRYDGANRLSGGDFVARDAVAQTWSAERQRYGLLGMEYDANGNITALQRRGLLQAATSTTPARYGSTDDLAYAYAGNQLLAVDDGVTGNGLPRPAGYRGAPASLAGDFQEAGVKLGEEYRYDLSGNLIQDKNKGITGIVYNHLNLPERVSFSATDYIEFRYSAAGQKVAKLVYQTGQPVVRTDYLGPYQYEGDSLRFFPHAEGRMLCFVPPAGAGGTVSVRYEREYTVKDHLGNLRLAYRAGRESQATATLEQDPAATPERERRDFDAASVSPPVAQPVGSSLARTGSYAARLNAGGSAPQPLGPLRRLAVQKGDVVRLTAPGRYSQPVSSNFLFAFGAFIANLLQPAAPLPSGEASAGPRRALPLLSIGLAAGLPSLTRISGGVPLGYARLLVFDTNENYVADATQTRQLSAAALNNYESLSVELTVPCDGFVLAYVGNESDTDVLFDDVEVLHRPTVQVQENSYDPWGLSLAGLDYSSLGLKGLNQYQFNGKERQNDLGLNWNDYGWRNYDPQMGRWQAVDPLADNREWLTPYNFVQNNPIKRFDPNGLTDFTLNSKTGEVKQVGKANEQPDRILKTNRHGEVKTKKNGEARVAVGGIEQGILKDGQNFKTQDNIIQVGGEGQPSVEGVKSFTLQLSEYVGREIKGFSYSGNASGNATDMLLGKYSGNSLKESFGTITEIARKYGDKYSANNLLQEFHTHPGGELGATQSAPGMSEDVKSLQNTKPNTPNASFIILYRAAGQAKPGEYDYTHEYRPQKK